MTAGTAPPTPGTTRHSGAWGWVAGAIVVGVILVLIFLLGYAAQWSTEQRWLCFGAITLVYCGLFAAAALRRDVSSRFRQALAITAGAFALTAASYLYGVVTPALGLPPVSDATDAVITVLTYAVALVGILRWPMTSLSRTRWWQFGIDATIGVGGMVLFFTALITLPGTEGSVPEAHRLWVRTYGSALLLDLVALNVLMVRGLALPSRRAFWTFMSALILEIVSLVVSQYVEYANSAAAAGGATDAIYIVVQLLYVCSGIFFLVDPVRGPSVAPLPTWLRTFNPLPLLAIIGVAALIVHESRIGDVQTTAIVAVGLVVLVVLLVIRLMATVLENMRLLQAEAAEERLRQAEKMGAVSRLAGGIAHEFNNLMTTVMGHAELGAEDVPADSSAREDFTRILEAGSRAAGLTNQLLAFSGQQVTQMAALDLTAFVRHHAEALAPRLPAGVTLTTAVGTAPAMVMGDARQLGLVLEQLVGNALAAMSAGGRLTLGVGIEILERALETAYLSVPPGAYVVLSVEDTGAGIAPQDLPRIFDPFFSTRPMHAAAGLGLAAVYGIVAAHDGGVAVESTPGRGTTLRLYFPRL